MNSATHFALCACVCVVLLARGGAMAWQGFAVGLERGRRSVFDKLQFISFPLCAFLPIVLADHSATGPLISPRLFLCVFFLLGNVADLLPIVLSSFSSSLDTHHF